MADKETPADPKEMVLQMLRGKSCMKQDVYYRTKEVFAMTKEVLQEIVDDLAGTMHKEDERIHIEFVDKGEIACEVKVAGDVIIFQMHTNVFKLDSSHTLWKSTYLEEDELRGYFGVINMYNFLSDSFRYNRERDIGYMVARLFLNKDDHYFVQGKRQLGFLYNDLLHNKLDREGVRKVLYSVFLYVIDFDLLSPPYDQVNQVSVSEMQEFQAHQISQTGKRLGFKFHADNDDFS